ncbi:MAG: tRNA preQ1(34) S-adenosylmethionine ribosyltransferase-isomerase QueA, partial [Pseudomonadota bacterium]
GRPLRKLREGDRIEFGTALRARVVRRDDEAVVLSFDSGDKDLQDVLQVVGQMPLPPYIAARRAPDAADRDDYQTVWARHAGAVAAPTASLHFDQDLLEALRNKGINFTEVTLHVGAGTFLPVKVEDVTTHRMHAEWGEITPEAAAAMAATKAQGGRVIPVGTTALRLIETAARSGKVEPFQGDTDIFIYPGFTFNLADGLMTNFHLPRSTLLMLVSALMGRERMLAAYEHAVRERYRFFSYGDASLLLP